MTAAARYAVQGERGDQTGLHMKRRFFPLLISVILAVTASSAYAANAPQEYRHPVEIGGALRGTIIIVGWKRDTAEIKKLVNLVRQRGDEAYRIIARDIRRLKSAAPKTPVAVGWQTAECLSKGRLIAEWTDVDVLVRRDSAGGSADLRINPGARTVTLERSGLRLSTRAVLEGYLVDLLLRYINAAGMKNVLVNVGTVFRGLGESLHGPWKVQVQEDSTTYAKHSFDISASNVGIATLSATAYPGGEIYDPRKRRMIRLDAKGATVIMNEAALAAGMAHAVMIAGPRDGMKLLERGSAHGLIVDASGSFLRKGL